MSRHPFQWPSDLSVELTQVGHATFLATVWQSLVSFAQDLRKQQQQQQQGNQQNDSNNNNDDDDDDFVLEGLPLDPSTGHVARTLTTVTAEQVWDLVQENQDVLVLTDDDSNSNQTKRGLWTKTMQDWIWTQFVQLLETCPPGTLSLVAWDSADDDMSFVLVREAHEKRWTLVLLGNHKHKHMVSPWYLAQSPFALLEDACRRGHDKKNHKTSMSFLESPTVHAGMSHLLFGSLNGQSSSLLDRIGHSLHPWLQAFPKYQLYVTGSPGVGAGLAQLVAVTLACQGMDHHKTQTTTSTKSTNDKDKDDTVSPLPSQLPTLSTPISCLAWGAPRLGNHGWLQHVQVLEQANRLRLLRIHTTNNNTTSPMWGFCHVGFQLNLSSNTTAVVHVSYPKLDDTCGARLHRAWSNRLSFLGHTNHKKSLLEAWHPYVQALQACRLDVAQWDWKELYQTTSYTGFVDPFTKSI